MAEVQRRQLRTHSKKERELKAKAFKCYHLCHKVTLKRQRWVRKQDQIGDLPKAAL